MTVDDLIVVAVCSACVARLLMAVAECFVVICEGEK
jgi:hypothetical protein